jgi:hypothetical protein
VWQLDGGHRPPQQPISRSDTKKPHISHTDNDIGRGHASRQTPGCPNIRSRGVHMFDYRTGVRVYLT